MKIKQSMKPVINNNINWEENDGEVVLIVKNRGIFNRILQMLMNKPEISYIHFDEIGSYIWKKIDGNNSVFDIGMSLENKYSNLVFPLYSRLITFLYTLKENRFITFR